MDGSGIETKALQATPFFASLTADDLQGILNVGREVSFEPGDAIVEEGDVGDAMYIVVSGSARVEAGGRFHMLKEGDFFGEMALIAAKKRMATVTAVDTVLALEIPAEGFQSFLMEHPAVGLSMMKALVDRLREVEQRIDAWMAS